MDKPTIENSGLHPLAIDQPLPHPQGPLHHGMWSGHLPPMDAIHQAYDLFNQMGHRPLLDPTAAAPFSYPRSPFELPVEIMGPPPQPFRHPWQVPAAVAAPCGVHQEQDQLGCGAAPQIFEGQVTMLPEVSTPPLFRPLFRYFNIMVEHSRADVNDAQRSLC